MQSTSALTLARLILEEIGVLFDGKDSYEAAQVVI
jgi:hypothetical protein